MKAENKLASFPRLFLHIANQRSRFAVLENDISWRVIWLVYDSHCKNIPIDISSVANSTSYSRNTVDKKINELALLGYIKINKDCADRRRKIITPTPKLLSEVERFCAAITPSIAKTSFEIQRNC